MCCPAPIRRPTVLFGAISEHRNENGARAGEVSLIGELFGVVEMRLPIGGVDAAARLTELHQLFFGVGANL
jgi:hypothetical protein